MSQSLSAFLHSKPCQEVLSWIALQEKSLIDTVQNWSHVNSGSRNLQGLATMIDHVRDFAQPLEATDQLIDLPPTAFVDEKGDPVDLENGKILQLIKRPDASKRLLLTGHLDTVFPVDSDFQACKWLSDTILNGPGVADMKGGVLVMLTALMALEKSPQANTVGWEVLLSPDEETGSLASGKVLTERAPTAHMGMTFEPAMPDGTLAGERKGSGNFTVVVRGKAAHAGREFYEGRNAVVALSQLMAKLSNLSGQREGLTVNPAVISGGVAANVVPDMAKCIFNVRLEKLADQDWLQEQLTALIDETNQIDGISAALFGGINRPPKEISPANQVMMDMMTLVGSELGISLTYKPTGGCCEGNNLAAAGLPNVDTLGVIGGLIHSDQEYVDVSSFVPRTQLAAATMMAFGAGYFDEVIALKEQQ